MTDPHHHQDALARALDLLPQDDPARTDPAFLRNPALTAEARAARETAVDVWLTVSPLTAAPADVLGRVMASIPAAPAPPVEAAAAAPRRRLLLTTLAAAGWAAAIVLAFITLRRDRAGETHSATGRTPTGNTVDAPRESAAPPPARTPAATPDPGRRLQEEILRLRSALNREESQEKIPRIKSLAPPGSIPGHSAEAQGQLRRMLINALRSTLEAETGAPGDSAVLVIERGWPAETIGTLSAGDTIRHRNFPEALWQDLGLLRSAEGSYYDPASRLIWSPDPEGRGFIGRPATPQDDLTTYDATGGAGEGRNPAPAPQPQTPPPTSAPKATPFVQAEPSGFLIENPGSGTVDIVIEGVQPTAQGETHWFVWTLPDGTTHERPVDPAMFTPSGTLVGNFATNNGSSSIPTYTGTFSGGSGPLMLTPGGLASLQLQTRSNTGTVTIIQTGP